MDVSSNPRIQLDMTSKYYLLINFLHYGTILIVIIQTWEKVGWTQTVPFGSLGDILSTLLLDTFLKKIVTEKKECK